MIGLGEVAFNTNYSITRAKELIWIPEKASRRGPNTPNLTWKHNRGPAKTTALLKKEGIQYILGAQMGCYIDSLGPQHLGWVLSKRWSMLY